MTTLLVTNTLDSGAGSLRHALMGLTPGASVHFSIESGPQTIQPLSPLPVIATSVTIDGRTQPGYSGCPLIRLDGIFAGDCDGLKIEHGRAEIRGLAITRFKHSGIIFRFSSQSTVGGCHIGTDETGSQYLGNRRSGIKVVMSQDCTIGGAHKNDRCIVSANHEYGIVIGGDICTKNKIVGNYVGTMADGRTPMGNRRSGILIYNAPKNIIGGSIRGEGNVISGNSRGGITVDGAQLPENMRDLSDYSDLPDFTGFGHCRGNQIQGNFIGTCKDGMTAVPNGLRGVLLNFCQDSLVGGVDEDARNIISGNCQDGILFLSPPDIIAVDPAYDLLTRGNRIEGNFIGLNKEGAPLGNLRHGILVAHSQSNFIRGETEKSGNRICNNSKRGILISGANSESNIVSKFNEIENNASGHQVLYR